MDLMTEVLMRMMFINELSTSKCGITGIIDSFFLFTTDVILFVATRV